MAINIRNIEGMSEDQINYELKRGGRFVVYLYCVSIVVLTFKRPGDVYFIKAGEPSIKYGLWLSLVSLLFGWWGLPWGPIHTVGSLWTNFRGGKDVTNEMLTALRGETT
ncbi:MAG: hypothetical protein LBH06_03755 [Rikenellaceae bacterium]|jgi:hypothetical protein|nr:hypothetical protein [Rikenellaceae bacterium]